MADTIPQVYALRSDLAAELVRHRIAWKIYSGMFIFWSDDETLVAEASHGHDGTISWVWAEDYRSDDSGSWASIPATIREMIRRNAN